MLCMLSKCVGGAQPNISQTIIKEMPIPKPSIEKQEAFASLVEQSDKSKLLISRLKEFILMGYRGHGKM